jgi:hypothetical protein
MPSWVMTFLATPTYLDRAFKSIRQVREVGQWTKDIVLIVPEDIVIPDVHRAAVDTLGIQLYHVKPRDIGPVTRLWTQHSGHPHARQVLNRPGLYLKYYIFDTFFRQWDIVFYMDAGAVIFGNLNRFTTTCEPRGWLYGHSDAYPTFVNKLNSQFAFDIVDKGESDAMKEKYDLSCDYFQGTMMIYNTSIIQDDTVDRLFELTNLYPYSTNGDQGILNLYFNLERRVWKPIPTRDEHGFLYDYHARSNFHPKEYVFLKIPLTL